MRAKVVAHYRDNRLIKGTTVDFGPGKESFHVFPTDDGASVEVDVSNLKGVFFVRDFQGNPDHKDEMDWGLKPRSGRRIIVRFADGEEMWGFSQTYNPSRPGFFLIPCDPSSNNERVYAVADSVREVVVEA